MDGHAHRCWNCDPVTFPRHDERLDERHAAVWFDGDRRDIDVYADGEKLTRCFEAYAGRGDGWAVVHSRCPLDVCSCGSGEPCLVRIIGDIRIVRAVPA